jgi:hypothetical protein
LTSDFQWSLYFAQLIGSRLKIWQHKRVWLIGCFAGKG